MIKIIELGCELPGTFEKRVSILDEALIKTASSDIQHFWNTFERKKDKGYLHIIAMSAGEWYSSNSNADYFSEENLKKYHRSFVDDANIFLFHVNKDPKISLGKPIYSTYNPNMRRVELVLEFNKLDPRAKIIVDKIKNGEDIFTSMGVKISHDECSICHNKAKTRQEYCFVPDTLVTMYDGCVKKINEVKEGDLLLDADGKITEVIETMSREVNENLVKFKTTINNFETQCTKNHPILSTKREDAGNCYYIKNVLETTLPCLPNSRYNCKTCSKTEFTKEFSDAGDLRVRDVIYAPYPDYTRFSNNDLDREDAWIIGLFAAEGCYSKHTINSGDHVKNGIVFSLNRDLEQHFVLRILEYFKKKYNKIGTVRPRVTHNCVTVNIGSKEIAEIFHSYVGEYASTKYFSQDIFYSQLNIIEELISGLWDGDGYDGYVSPKRVNTSIRSVLVSISPHLASQTALLLSILGRDAYTSITPAYLNKKSGYNYSACYRVDSDYRNNSSFDRDDNIRVNRGRTDTHIVGYIKSKEETPYQGTVYNLETTSGTYIANGIAVHNCDHLKYNMNKILPDGRKVYAINPAPYKFFDISLVNRPADKMAYALQKEASAIQEDPNFISSAELGEQYEATQAKLASLKKLSDMIKFIDGDIVNADGLDDNTKSQYEILKALKKQDIRSLDYPVMDYNSLEELDASPGAIIRIFISNGAPPSIGEMAYAAGKHSMGNSFKEDMIPSMLSKLPDAISKLRENPDTLESILHSVLSNYKGELDSPESAQRLNTLTAPIISRRIMIIKKACDQNELEKMASFVPTYHDFNTLRSPEKVNVIRYAKDLIHKNMEDGRGVLETHNLKDLEGNEYITNNANILTANLQDNLLLTGKGIVGSTMMLAGILALVSNAPLLQKTIAGLGLIGSGIAVRATKFGKTRIQVGQQLEIPNNTIFSRVHPELSKLGADATGTGSLWHNNRAAVMGLTVPSLLGLDYLYNKHVKYKDDPYLEENLSPIGRLAHKAGRVVVDNPITSLAGSGIAATMLGEMMKRKPKV